MTVFASIEDLRAEAERRIPKPFYDYLQNGAFTQTTMQSNRDDLNAVKLHERMLDVGGGGKRSTASTMVGQQVTFPVALAPVGLSGANHGRGEILAAEAAKEFGVPYCLSTFSIAAIEDIAKAVGNDFWFQLYPMQDQKVNESLIGRARDAGCPALIVTVDALVEGTRYNDVHNGLGVPPKLNASNMWAFATHPLWLARMASSPHYTFGNIIGESSVKGLDNLAEWVKSALRQELDRDFLRWIRSQWRGKLIFKGILSIDDFRVARDCGVDAVVVSNHGGRQLEGGVSTIQALPGIAREADGKVEILADSGIRTGIDILRMLGLGADGCLIGRAYNYGLGASGKAGVTAALSILHDELTRTMALTGVTDITSLPPDLIQSAPELQVRDAGPPVHRANLP